MARQTGGKTPLVESAKQGSIETENRARADIASTNQPPSHHPGIHHEPRGNQKQTIGCSRGSLTTKILALVNALGNLVRFVLLPEQRHDMKGVEDLIADVPFKRLLADEAFDVDWLRAELEDRGIVAVIPPKANRKRFIPCDFAVCKWRHLTDNFSCSLKAFRRVGT